MFNFVFLSLKRWLQFNSRIVGIHFASVMSLKLYFQMKFLLPSTLCLRKLPYREFKKLQWLLHRKRPIEIERSVSLSALRLFNDWRTAPSFAWQEWSSCKGKE